MRFGRSVELHLHMDNSMSFEAISRLDPSVTRERYGTDFAGPERFVDLAAFLGHTRRHLALQQDEVGLRTCVADVVAQLDADDVLYAELRYAPMLHLDGGLRDHEVVAIVEDELGRVLRTARVTARVILCTLRHFTAEQSVRTARLAVEAAARGLVVGFDLAGDEAGFPLGAHLPAFAVARDAGVAITVHAGEALGAASVWEVLRALDPPRIGHGVRSIEDPALVAHLAAAGTHLELCPSCNVQISVVPSWPAHPIDALHRAGVSVGVSTDQRAITATTMRAEMDGLVRHFGWSAEMLHAINAAALDAAFVDPDLKAVLRRELDRSWLC